MEEPIMKAGNKIKMPSINDRQLMRNQATMQMLYDSLEPNPFQKGNNMLNQKERVKRLVQVQEKVNAALSEALNMQQQLNFEDKEMGAIFHDNVSHPLFNTHTFLKRAVSTIQKTQG